MEKDIRKIILDYLRYWYLFLIGSIICLSLAFLYLKYKAVPKYKITSKVILNDKSKATASSGIESLGDLGLLKLSEDIQNEIGVLKSSDYMEVALKELNMNISYFVEDRFDKVEVYSEDLPFYIKVDDSLGVSKQGVLGQILIKNEKEFQLEREDSLGQIQKSIYKFGDNISNNSLGIFKVFLRERKLLPKHKKPIIVKFNDIKALSYDYSNKITIVPLNKNGGLLDISLVDAIPKRGVAFVNELLEVYTKKSIEYKNLLANTTIELINERLKELNKEISGVEKNVESYKKSNVLTNVSSDAERFSKEAGAVDKQLEEVRLQIDALNTLDKYLEENLTDSSVVLSSFNIEDTILIGLIAKHNELLQERKNLLRTTEVSNPLIIESNKQLLDFKKAISDNLKGIKFGLNSTKNNLVNNAKRYKSKIFKVPSAERALLEIKRDISIKQNIYLYLLQKREEEALSITASYSNLRIIEQPRSGYFPISPSKTPIYFGALLFGFFVPFLFVFAKDKINDKIQGIEDIKCVTDNVILGVIAESNKKETVVVSEKSDTYVAELFRLLRFNLKFIIDKNESSQVLMITSGKKGEGKTFFTTNLGMSLAITKKKVVVINFDFRNPSSELLKNSGLSSTIGVTDYIVDSGLFVDDIIVNHKKEKNLYFIGAGSKLSNPGELMVSERIEILIEELKKTFDYILIDTAPIGKVADPFLLGSYLDATLYIVRNNYTTKSELNEVNEISNKLKSVMLVMNDMKVDKYNTYGYEK